MQRHTHYTDFNYTRSSGTVLKSTRNQRAHAYPSHEIHTRRPESHFRDYQTRELDPKFIFGLFSFETNHEVMVKRTRERDRLPDYMLDSKIRVCRIRIFRVWARVWDTESRIVEFGYGIMEFGYGIMEFGYLYMNICWSYHTDFHESKVHSVASYSPFVRKWYQ